MENIKEYRVINSEEREEIERLANNALILLKLNLNEQSSTILKKMDEFVETFSSTDIEVLEKYGYELGSLFGNLIRKEHNWEWYWLDADDEIFYCIASPKEKACCVCHNYFYAILTKDHSNNFRLLFNMIEHHYPKDWHFMVLS
jgi:hypothetical protein